MQDGKVLAARVLVLQVDPRCARDADPVPLLGVLLTDEHLPSHDQAGDGDVVVWEPAGLLLLRRFFTSIRRLL